MQTKPMELPGVRLADFDMTWALTTEDAGKQLLTRGKSPAQITRIAGRYMTKGARPMGKNGPWFLLPSIKFGAARYTMQIWIDAFVKAIVEHGQPPLQEPGPRLGRTPGQRTAAQKRAGAVLDVGGVPPTPGPRRGRVPDSIKRPVNGQAQN